MLFRSLLGAGLVDTVELGVSPLLLGSPGMPLLALDPPLTKAVRLELTQHTALPSGLLVLEYTVRQRARSTKPVQPRAPRARRADSKQR